MRPMTSSSNETPDLRPPVWRRVASRIVEVAVLLLVGGFFFLALRGDHPESTPIRDYLVVNASRETGALNLVTAIYLGYRAYDTLGETIVLLLAVSGVMVFAERRK